MLHVRSFVRCFVDTTHSRMKFSETRIQRSKTEVTTSMRRIDRKENSIRRHHHFVLGNCQAVPAQRHRAHAHGNISRVESLAHDVKCAFSVCLLSPNRGLLILEKWRQIVFLCEKFWKIMCTTTVRHCKTASAGDCDSIPLLPFGKIEKKLMDWRYVVPHGVPFSFSSIPSNSWSSGASAFLQPRHI